MEIPAASRIGERPEAQPRTRASGKATEILQEILDEVTLEFFAEPQTPGTEAAGARMRVIGQLLYDRPRNFLRISLWEQLAALNP